MNSLSRAVEHRNRLSHKILSSQERAHAAEDIWRTLRELDAAVKSAGLRLFHVHDSKPKFLSDGSIALVVDGVWLTGQSARNLGPFEAQLTEGLWLRDSGDQWISMTPMMVWRRCDCNTLDVFTAIRPPGLEGEFRMVGTHHGEHVWSPGDRAESTPSFDWFMNLLNREERFDPGATGQFRALAPRVRGDRAPGNGPGSRG